MAAFHYALPDALIARYPAEPRDSSRLLVLLAGLPAADGSSAPSARGALAAHVAREARTLHAGGSDFVDCAFRDVTRLLPEGAHLVFNESRVFAARLFGVNASASPSGTVEVLLLAPDRPGVDPADALGATVGTHEWRAMVRADVGTGAVFCVGGPVAAALSGGTSGAKLLVRVSRVYSSWIEEEEADGVEAAVQLYAPASEAAAAAAMAGTFPSAGGAAATAAAAGGGEAPVQSLSTVLELLGQIPIPPYLRRSSEPSDSLAYQTVFASAERTGSVAAPTAGLHFTQDTLEQLRVRGVQTSRVALHVGAGTFRPVTAAEIASHEMHSEPFAMSARELLRLASSADHAAPIVAVGTTSARALESMYSPPYL
ncbi:Queuosine biosynthesis protein-domain-containing protein [Pavlovales sp. CCMP2436]|nr:Queuosine biosynthesis protein-domain-containing protein [Pavlovales sp. CCMP2436]